MAPSRVIILGVAGIAAIGAGYLAKVMSERTPQTTVVESREPAIRLTEVLVLDEDVRMGGILRDKLSWQAWPSAGVNEFFITRDSNPDAIETLQASIARVPMYTGEPLRRSKLIGEGQAFMSSILPAGMRAVATQISVETSAGGFILPNDRVDVIMTRTAENSNGTGGLVTETILENIRVLAIDQAIQESEEGGQVIVGSTATLELTPNQAEIITAAQQMASRLTLALRAVADAQEKVGPGADYLVSSGGRGDSVRMIKSGEVTDVGTRQ